VGGVLSLIAGFTPDCCWEWLPEPSRFYLLWGSVAVLTIAANTGFVWRDARLRNAPLVSSGMRMALRSITPSLIAGGAIFCLFPDVRIAPLLMIFYGLALLATAHFAPTSIALLGWAFLLTGLGLLALFATAVGSSLLWWHGHQIMGAVFGGYHLIYAAAVYLRQRQ